MPSIDLGSVVGPQGPQGVQGPQGNAGPNQVTGDTSTTLNGILYGENGAVAAKDIVGAGGVPVYGKGMNLLDNWYFGNSVNQRGQTEYTGTGYTIDRWYSARANVALTGDGISLTWNSSGSGSQNNGYMMYRGENGAEYSGKTVTASIVIDGLLYSVSGTFPEKGGASVSSGFTLAGTDMRILVEWSSASEFWDFAIANNSVTAHTISAAKLELGDTQTLAHQDANGNWVLNDPPPNKQQKLEKCQRYYQVFATEALRPTNARDFRPVMRTTPALGTIDIDGVTYYYASAEL